MRIANFYDSFTKCEISTFFSSFLLFWTKTRDMEWTRSHLREHDLQCISHGTECVYSPHRTWSPVHPSYCWVRVLTSQNMVSSASLMLLSACTHLREHGLQHLPGCAECVYSPHRTWSPAPAWLCWMRVLTSQNMGLQHLPHAAECMYSPQRTWSPAPAWLCWMHVLTSENMVFSTCLVVLNVCTHLREHGLQCLPHGAECMYSPHRTWSPVPPSSCWMAGSSRTACSSPVLFRTETET